MSTDKIVSTLQRIKNDESLQDYFFKKLADASNPLEWLVPLLKAGYFSPENNPKHQQVPNKVGYFTIPHWNILDALTNMAVKNENSPNDTVSHMLLEIVDGIISYRDEGGERITNFRTDWKMLQTIAHFPIQYIGEKHIEFIKESLHGTKATLIDREIDKLFFPKLIKEKATNLIIKLLDVILHYQKSDEEYSDRYIPVIDKYYLKKTLDHNKKGISDICPIEAAKVALSKMHEILENDDSHFNYVWIPAIEDHEQNRFPDRYEYQVVSFLRDMLESADSIEREPLVIDMLSEEHVIFKRVAYHMINHCYDSLSHLFWDITYNPINGMATHELYELIKAHCKSFNETQIKTVLDWIEVQNFYFSDHVSGDSVKETSIKAYRKKEWLIALIDSGSAEVKRLYEAYNAINDAPIEHPGFHYWSYGARSIIEVSPIDEKEFNLMTHDEMAAYINSYKEVDTSWEHFTRINLASTVRRLVSSDPEKYSVNLEPFLSIPLKYQYEVLIGLEEAWRNNKNFDWDELFSFMLSIVEDSGFWDIESIEGQYDYKRWITDAIADLVREGTRSDKHAFPPELLPKAEKIILLLLNNTKSELHVTDDLTSSVFSSSKGRVLTAAINYSLRNARINCSDTNERWAESIKTEFSRRLDKTIEPSLELSAVIGEYLINIDYLDKKWVNDNINRIFDTASDKHWEAAFVGHIVMQSTVYEEIYCLLRDNGHYEKGLSHNFSEKSVNEKLVQNIAVGYMAGWDDFSNSNSLLRKLFDTNNVEYLSILVSFVGTYRHKEDKELIGKIKPLWKSLIERVTPNLTDVTYRVIASNLGMWLSLVDTIDDDIFEWLKVSAEAIEENWNSMSFIEYLSKHVAKSPIKVGDLYLRILHAGTYPIYDEENIVAIVQSLYDLSEKDTANKICNIYFSKGFEFLRETFEKRSKA